MREHIAAFEIEDGKSYIIGLERPLSSARLAEAYRDFKETFPKSNVLYMYGLKILKEQDDE